ncbi:MAG: hypothetical protein IPO18_08960 [bacterium]|nr:hypothetical protein [bacterium]
MTGATTTSAAARPPSDITYRGPSAASELETQAMINFVNGREIITHDSVHTYSGMTLYPWGYINSPSPQDATFQHIAQKMTAEQLRVRPAWRDPLRGQRRRVRHLLRHHLVPPGHLWHVERDRQLRFLAA